MLETTLAQGIFMTATQRKLKALLNEESSVRETLTNFTPPRRYIFSPPLTSGNACKFPLPAPAAINLVWR